MKMKFENFWTKFPLWKSWHFQPVALVMSLRREVSLNDGRTHQRTVLMVDFLFTVLPLVYFSSWTLMNTQKTQRTSGSMSKNSSDMFVSVRECFSKVVYIISVRYKTWDIISLGNRITMNRINTAVYFVWAKILQDKTWKKTNPDKIFNA